MIASTIEEHDIVSAAFAVLGLLQDDLAFDRDPEVARKVIEFVHGIKVGGTA